MRAYPAKPVFSRNDLRGCGWTDSAITRAIRSGRMIRLRHGQLTASGGCTELSSAIAATAACTGGVMSNRSALLLHGLPIVGSAPPVPELTVQPRRIGSLQAAHLYRATLTPADVTVVDGQPVTTVARTLVDVGRHHSTTMAVAALDKALHEGWTSLDELAEVTLRCWNWPGIRRALRAIRLCDGRSESPLESSSRLVMRWLQLPEPELQPVIRDQFGCAVARLDFYWDEFGVAGEADGRSKYQTVAGEAPAFPAEKIRQEHLEDLAMVVTRWGWVDLRRPQALRTRLERAFDRGSRRDRSGVRRRWSVHPT